MLFYTLNFRCTYRGISLRSMHGKITDFQMWDMILPDDEMIQITGCKMFREGNFQSWAANNWFLNSSRGTARKEMLDLEQDVCQSTDISLHLIPYPIPFHPDAPHVCSKFSGEVVQYSKKDKFDKIITFLSAKQHMETTNCLAEVKDMEGLRLRVWIANGDSEEEGVFKNWYTNQPIEHAPWGRSRPYDKGFKYQCMLLEV